MPRMFILRNRAGYNLTHTQPSTLVICNNIMSTPAKSLSGTRTEALIVQSYLAESSAYTRYTYYAQQAQKESYIPIQKVFEETAANELHHSKVFFKMLKGGKVTVEMSDVDAGIIGTTAQNLAIAAAEEKVEGVEAYTNAAKVAREEGFDEIADHFEAIATVELRHMERFNRLRKQVEEGTVWKRDTPITWQCLVCGYRYVGTEPPAVCPGCDHPYQHYMPLDLDLDL